MSLLGVVPARGGSKRLRRKNLLPLAGRPLVLHAADNLAAVCDRVVISTDDVEIESVALSHGYEVHNRDTVDDAQTVAECAAMVVDDLGWDGDVLLLQPTAPLVDVQQFLERARQRHLPSIATHPTTHQHWADGVWMIDRPSDTEPTGVKYLDRESGLYWWPAGSDFGPPLEDHTAAGADVDIDTVEDYRTAQLRANRKRILIEYVEGDDVGSGHRRRAETLAAALQHHDVTLRQRGIYQNGDTFTFVDDGSAELTDTRHVEPIAGNPDFDMVITDTLDNERKPFQGDALWVTFEDHGPAATTADLVVNALYPVPPSQRYAAGYVPQLRTGPDWAVLRPEFLDLPPFDVRETALPRVLLMFGGTDPASLRLLALRALGHLDPTLVKPGDNIPVAATMRQHDILVTSAGRTVYEAAAVGIPTIVMAQNNREATHVHLGPSHGNIYLGLGRLVTPETLRHTVEQVASDVALRRELSQTARASVDGKGLDRIVHAIDGLLEGL